MPDVFSVLVVDDYEDARILYADALRENGFVVWTASDGAELILGPSLPPAK